MLHEGLQVTLNHFHLDIYITRIFVQVNVYICYSCASQYHTTTTGGVLLYQYVRTYVRKIKVVVVVVVVCRELLSAVSCISVFLEALKNYFHGFFRNKNRTTTSARVHHYVRVYM